MKKSFTLITVFVSLLFLLADIVNGQWANNPPHIYNTNASNVGIGNGALWAPSEKLHVNTFGVGIAGIMAENSVAGNGPIGYFRIKNSASNYMFNMVLRKVAGNHEMLQSCYDASVNLWREFVYFNFATRKYEMRFGVMDAEFLNSGKFLISSVGNTGIGVANPLEKLDVNGAVRIGNTVNNNAGTIRWDGFNFQGHNGGGWVQLDNVGVPAPTWIMIPNPMPVPQNNPQLYPVLPPSTITNLPPGLPNNTAWIYSTDVAAPGLYQHQLTLESIVLAPPPPLPPASASLLYQIANGPFPAAVIANYSAGVHIGDLNYKICRGPVLTPTSQGDAFTMFRADPMGIIDLPNQSRARAYQQDPNQVNQPILPNLWTPVNFTNNAPLPQGYDEQNEFVVAAAANMPAPPVNAQFWASKAGYYQVNARVEFNTDYSQQYGPVGINPNSYVSIAIYVGGVPYAYGNNLQIGCPAGPLHYNNAPNVSDVVYLNAQQSLSIWVFHTANTPMDLNQGPAKVYVSIHKVS